MKPSYLSWILSLGLTLVSVGCKPSGDTTTGPAPAVVLAMNRGVSAMGQYDYDSAVKAFEEVVKAQPALADAQVNLAIARFNRARKEDRDLDRAGELLEAVLKADTNSVRALYFKGVIQQHIGNTEEAVKCFQKVVEQRPEDGAAWYLLGMCRQRLNQPCERELLKAIELRPYLGSAYYKLWQALQAAGQTDKAQPYLDKFKELRQNPLNETIELPQYNQMGELALAQPLPFRSAPPITRSKFALKDSSAAFEITGSLLYSAQPGSLGGAVLFPGSSQASDVSRNVLVTASGADGAGRLVLLRGTRNGAFVDATAGSGLESVRGALACAMGDVDNDGRPDLVAVGEHGVRLLLGKEGDRFADVTASAGPPGQAPGGRSALLLDADHDGDLDILICSPGTPGNQLWNNNADGTYTNLAPALGLACPDAGCVLALSGDLDGDRDTDLVFLCAGQPAKIFLNDLLGGFHEVKLDGVEIHGELGGVLDDFNGDGQLDLMVLGGAPARLQLYTGDGHGRFHPSAEFAKVAEAAATWGALRGFRVADLDLDGDLDVALFSQDIHLLFNDASGHFVLQPRFYSRPATNALWAAELADVDGDSVPELWCVEGPARNRVRLVAGELAPPSTALSLALTGVRERDKRTRSPATPYGTGLTIRSGLRQQSRRFSGQSGGFNQSPLPLVFGLDGAKQADYVQLRWPDGVVQVETALASGPRHTVAELERKISSCPVLFAWNGERFEFIADFAGVGGLGYFSAPGQYAPPQVLEHVKLEPNQLRPRDGTYELRVAEPMEESAYVDRLELLAVDHPADWSVFPDERLALSGPAPTHELLVVEQPIFPERALGPGGRDCTAELLKVDRVYAYHPELDRRFFGFCRSHTLEVDFGSRLASVSATQRLFLFLNGFLEYPYSQTTYAAAQARVAWEPIRIERAQADGRWQTILPDAGAFGGMARTMTVDLTGLLTGPTCRLRLTSNLEIFYDQLFVAGDAGRAKVRTHSATLLAADLRRVGFPREYSPDGRFPLLYDYELRDASAPFHTLRGAYTRYGPVAELLKAFDDQYVLVGPGDEIALSFDAARLPALPPGFSRSFILVSHAYCKDMDLYTATPQTLAPLPFRAMSCYPYPPTEHFPDSPAVRQYQQTYNTRLVE